ncbi:MAG: relaxase domain-containing protein [Rhodospirillaceae bacterium]|nr:relaxase domain-containing protein [Rhodospirillaceae bacterium]
MLSIGALSSAAQGANYYERDGYYAKDDPEHRAASGWAGKGAEELGLKGPVDPDTFRAVLEGKVPDGSDTRLGRRGKDGEILHRPGRDLTFSAPKSVSLAALVGGDRRIAEAHDRAVAATLAWVEKNAAETRMKDPETGRMGRVGNQKIVAATFRHDTSRNLDPQLHTHAVLANMVRGEDGKWRSMANEGLYARQKLIGMLYRNELAAGLSKLGYDIEKTHADGRFEIAGMPRAAIEAFSSRRAEIEEAMAARDLGSPAENPRLAERAALMTRAVKRDIDREELRGVWQKQAADLGLAALVPDRDPGMSPVSPAVENAAAPERGVAVEPPAGPGTGAPRAAPEMQQTDGAPPHSGGSARAADASRQIELPFDGRVQTAERDTAAETAPSPRAADAVAWATAHLSERAAVFSRTDLFAAALAHAPGAAAIGDVEREVAALEKAGELHAVNMPGAEDSLATDRTVGEERETVALWRSGQGRGRAPMRNWQVQGHLNKGPLTAGQKDAVKLILTAQDRTVGIQGYAGTGKTTMLNRARTLAEKKGWRIAGLAPSASAVQTLASEAGIESETLQMFLARNAGVAEGRLTGKGAREMRAAFAKTILVVDEGSLASTVQARDLLRIANALRIPRVVLVGDAKQLDAVDAGKPFAQLQAAGMQTATMDEIMRQRDPALKEAVEASLKGDIERAFEKLGGNVAEVKPDNIAGAVAARWLRLDEDARVNTGVMAPSHALRQGINGHIRERLAREGRIHGPAMESERLVSKGYTNAEKALAANYGPGDVVAFHRPYKRIGVEKGDERRVIGVDHTARAVLLDGGKGGRVAWKPEEIGGRRGGSEVYRAEEIELRAGDRIRWTRNDAGLGLVNSRTAEVLRIANGRVTFRLEDGKTLELGKGDPQLRHLDHAWASTVHAFQGRTVDNVIAAMEARHPHLTTQKSFYVEISRARDRAELVTDDAAELRAQLQAVTGERIAALEGIGEVKPESARIGFELKEDATSQPVREPRPERGKEGGNDIAPSRERAPKGLDRDMAL